MNKILDLSAAVCAIAKEASALIMCHYANPITHEKKADHSPVTIADQESNDLIVAGLRALTPEISIVSEEGEQAEVTAGEWFWLVDPLDGTLSYIARDDEFSVNIALIHNRRPVLGVQAIPAKILLYWAAAGDVAYRQIGEAAPEIIRCRTVPAEGLTVMTSKSHGSARMQAFLAEYKVAERVRAGSAYKITRVAEGSADFYPRLGPTMEWDTAAGHCILEAAGGSLTTVEGAPFLYGKAGYLNDGFVARGLV
jgi:3'(2'), 5'-bisphosphate nucleotidase